MQRVKIQKSIKKDDLGKVWSKKYKSKINKALENEKRGVAGASQRV
jgi:hypothetical protein